MPLNLPLYQPGPKLAGKVVVITGSTRGLGLSLAHAFAREGTRLVLHGRTPESVQGALEQVRQQGASAEGIAVDLREPESARLLLEAAVAAYGGVDVLVCNAAIAGAGPGPPWSVEPASWDEVLAVNLAAALRCASEALGWMMRVGSDGRLVAISSAAAESPAAGFAAYAASKAGLEGLFRALALEARGSRVGVAVVRVQSLRTDMTRALVPADVFSRLPLPDCVSAAVLFAASGPRELVHGRCLSAARFARDPVAEAVINGPPAGVREPGPGPVDIEIERLRGEPGVISLDRAENPRGVPPAVRTALGRAAESPGLHLYPDDDCSELRRSLSLRLGVPGECITFGAGSTELIERALRLFVHPGESVVSSDPGWFLFDRMCALLGVSQRKVPFSLDPGTRRSDHNLEGVLAAIDESTRLVYLIHPHNPVGVALDRAGFETFVSRVPPQVTVVLDEAYIDYVTRAAALRSLPWALGGGPRVVVVRSFSKAYGLAGMRVGYAVSRPEASALLRRLSSPFPLTRLGAVAAEAALGDDAFVRRCRDENLLERTRLEEGLDELSIGRFDSDANFVLCERPASESEFHRAFERRRMLLPRGLFLGRYTLLPVGLPEHTHRQLEVLGRLTRGLEP